MKRLFFDIKMYPLSIFASLFLAALLTGCAALSAEAPRATSYVDEETAAAAVSGVDTSPVVSPVIVPDEPSEPLPEQTNRTAARSSTVKSAQTSEKLPAAADGTILSSGKDGPDSVRILFLGDGQYSEGRGTGTEIPAIICRNVQGPCTVYNLAIPGSTASLDTGSRDMAQGEWNSTSLIGMAHLLKGDVSTEMFEYNHPDLVEALQAIDREALDFIVMDYGLNDYLDSKQIYDEEDGDDPTDFSPAYRKGLALLEEACPNARILCCTPCYSQFYGKDGALLGEGSSLPNSFGNLGDYVAAIDYNYRQFDRADYVDMYNGTRMDLDVYTVEEYMADGIHLTERGRHAYAEVIAQFIDKMRGIITEEYQLVTIDDH